MENLVTGNWREFERAEGEVRDPSLAGELALARGMLANCRTTHQERCWREAVCARCQTIAEYIGRLERQAESERAGSKLGVETFG